MIIIILSARIRRAKQPLMMALDLTIASLYAWKFTFAKDIDHRVGCCRPLHANMSLAGWYPSTSCQTAQKTDCTLVACQSSFQVLVPTLCVRATRTTCARIPIISQSSPCPLPPHPYCPPPRSLLRCPPHLLCSHCSPPHPRCHSQK